ncbi:MAG: putative metalloprotease CJM1_0395 family protein [Rhodospirillaceae bacterium]
MLSGPDLFSDRLRLTDLERANFIKTNRGTAVGQDESTGIAAGNSGRSSASDQIREYQEEARKRAAEQDQQRNGSKQQAAREDLRQSRNLLDPQTLAALREEQEADARLKGEPEPNGAASGGSSVPGQDLTEEEEQIVRDLQKTDREVRQHESAHKSVGGPLASPPVYQYTRGPDGRSYAISGEVKIDASPEQDPEETIRKMEQVKRAALAPAEPSPQDRQVAAQADATKAQAQAELAQEKAEELKQQQAEQKAREAQQDQVNQAGQLGVAQAAALQPASADPTQGPVGGGANQIQQAQAVQSSNNSQSQSQSQDGGREGRRGSLLQALKAVRTYGRTAAVLGRTQPEALSGSGPNPPGLQIDAQNNRSIEILGPRNRVAFESVDLTA